MSVLFMAIPLRAPGNAYFQWSELTIVFKVFKNGACMDISW